MSSSLHHLFIGGTASHVGKSLITAGMCRILKQDGYKPAPYKAQNMALNSYATPERLEIGRAQALQAAAAGIPCHVDMNPVLLKPSGANRSQVVVLGQPAGEQTAREYFGNNRQNLWPVVTAAFDRLARQYAPIVLEGAGSIAEINLWPRDLVNLRMAAHADARILLVADIDRGGVFGSVYGTLQLLPEGDRARVIGVIVNQFRGDASLFEDGRRLLAELAGVPVLGVIPYLPDLNLDDEDSVSLGEHPHQPIAGQVNVGVPRLPHLSNFTDFRVLSRVAGVHVYYPHKPVDLTLADIIILPGTKNTIADLSWLNENGMATVIQQRAAAGLPVIGICGGYQMMGQWVKDPAGVEGPAGTERQGLNLLPVITELQTVKQVQQRHFRFRGQETIGRGYEIHMGVTHVLPELAADSATTLDDGSAEGCWLDARCWGTYLHGILDNPTVVQALLEQVRPQTTFAMPEIVAAQEASLDRWAEHLRRHLDLPTLYHALRR